MPKRGSLPSVTGEERDEPTRLLDLITLIRQVRARLYEMDAAEFTSERDVATQLRDQTTRLLFDHHQIEANSAVLQVAIIGDFNAGKSSFINSLFGHEICPVAARPTTSSLSYFRWGDEIEVHRREAAGTRSKLTLEQYRSDVCHPVENEGNTTPTFTFDVRFPLPLLRDVTLIDTPGFHNGANPRDADITRDVALRADVVIFVMDIERGEIGADTANLIRDLQTQSHPPKPWRLVLNCVDKKAPSRRGAIRDSVWQKHGTLFEDQPWLYSSLLGLQTNEDAERSWLTLTRQRVARAARSGEPVELRLTGEPGREGEYALSVDGAACIVRAGREQDVTPPEVMLHSLRGLAQRKRKLLGDRYRQRRSATNAKANDFAAALRRRCGLASTELDSGLIQRVGQSLRAYLTLSAELRNALVDAVLSSAYARKLSQDEASYWSEPYAKIEASGTRLRETLERSKLRLDELVRECLVSEGAFDSSLATSLLFGSPSPCAQAFIAGITDTLLTKSESAFADKLENLGAAQELLSALRSLHHYGPNAGLSGDMRIKALFWYQAVVNGVSESSEDGRAKLMESLHAYLAALQAESRAQELIGAKRSEDLIVLLDELLAETGPASASWFLHSTTRL